MVMSETGVMVTSFCQGEPVTFNVYYKVVREVCVDKELKRKLIQHFKDSRGDVVYSVNPALGHLPLDYPYPERSSKINSKSKDRQLIVDFLSGINNTCYPKR